jgi:hypothetical protein
MALPTTIIKYRPPPATGLPAGGGGGGEGGGNGSGLPPSPTENPTRYFLDGAVEWAEIDWAVITGIPATFPPSKHAPSHATNGNDPIPGLLPPPLNDPNKVLLSTGAYGLLDYSALTGVPPNGGVTPDTMLKSVYDINGDNIVDRAAYSDSVLWAGIKNPPATFPPSKHAPAHAPGGADPIPVASTAGSGLLNALSGNPLDYIGGDNACHGVLVATGPQGPPGVNACTTTASGFIVPPYGSTAPITVVDGSWIVPGQVLALDRAGGGVGKSGVLTVLNKAGNTLTLLNSVSSGIGAAVSGSAVPIGSLTSPGGAPGTSIIIKGTVPISSALPATGNTLGDLWIALDTGHGWVWTAPGTWTDIGPALGPTGPKGAPGTNAYTLTSTSFTVPPVGGTANLTVADASWMVVGQVVYVDSAAGPGVPGTLTIQSIAGNTLTLLNPSTSPVQEIKSIGWIAGMNPNGATIFIANRSLTITGITGIVEVANGAAATITIVKAGSGTPLSGGTPVHSGSFNANGTPATNQTLSLTVTNINAGERLGLLTTGTFTAAVGDLSVFVQ